MGFFVLEGKMACGVESQSLGDFLDAHIGSRNQILGLSEADFHGVFLWAESGGLFEMPIKRQITHTEFFGDIVDVEAGQEEFAGLESDFALFWRLA